MDLKRLELEVLEQVYNIIVNIPESVITSIPSLKCPLVLLELKRLRQQIKNKLKIGHTRLAKENLTPSASSNTNFSYTESKPRTSFTNEFDSSANSQHEKDTSSTTHNQTNAFNDSNTSTNKWFNNHSDFQPSTTPAPRLTSNHTDIYSRERLSVNQLDSIVNNSNFDSFCASDAQKPMQPCPTTNNRPNTSTNLQTRKSLPCSSYKGNNSY